MKNKNIFLQPVLFIAFVIFNLTSQSTLAQIDFERVYQYQGSCVGESIVQTSDGGYAVFSNAGPYLGPHTTIMIKTNEYGDSLWSTAYPSRYLVSAFGLPDGGFAIFAKRWVTSTWLSSITRIDSLGNEAWERIYGDGFTTYSPLSMSPLSDGGFAVTAVISNTKSYLLKINSVGDTVWSKDFAGGGNKVIQSSDGGYVIAGSQYCQANPINDCRIWKMDSSGNLIWVRHYLDGGNTWPRKIIQTSDDGYLVLGGSNLTTYDSINILKLDATGDSLWAKWFVRSGGWFDAGDVIQTADDGYAICGMSETAAAACLLKTNSSGDSLWIKFYPHDLWTWFNGMSATNDGEIIMCGTSRTLPDTLINTFVVKTDSFGTITTVSAQKPSAPSFTLNPNPATSQLRLSFPAGKLPGSLVIQNVLGEVVTTVKIYSNGQLVDVSYLSQGIYVIKSNDGIMVKKFVKQ